MQRWYLVRTKANAEGTACRNLERQGYAVYLPRLQRSVLSRGRWRDRVVPLFPGYVFLGLDEGRQALAPVHSTHGVAGLVRFGASYAQVPDEILRGLRSRADPGTSLHCLAFAARLLPGAPVRIVAGPFDGLEGVFEREAGEDRVIVLLSVLGQWSSVGVSAGSVVPRHAA